MSVKLDGLNSVYSSLLAVNKDAALSFINGLSEEDYVDLKARRENERSIPEQIKSGLIKGVTPSQMDSQLDRYATVSVGDEERDVKLKPSTLEQAMELGTETGKVISEGGATEAGAGAGMALGSIPVVGGATAGGLLGAKYGEMAGNALGGHPLIGGAIGAGVGGLAGAFIPGAGPIMGGIYGAGKGGELVKRAEDYAGIKAGEAAGLDTTGAAEQSNTEANTNFLLGSGAKTLGLGAKKILATNAAKDILRNATAIGETTANKVYTTLGNTQVGKAALDVVKTSREAGVKLKDSAKAEFDKINNGFKRSKEVPPTAKRNFLSGETSSVKNPIDLSKEIESMPEGYAKDASLRVTGADKERFIKISGADPKDKGFDKAYKVYRSKALSNATDKELEAVRRYVGDSLDKKNFNSGAVADLSDTHKNLTEMSKKTRFGNPIAGWKEMKMKTESSGGSSADKMFNEVMSPEVPLEDKVDKFSEYLFGNPKTPTDSIKKITSLNKDNPDFSRNFLLNSVRKLAHDNKTQNTPFIEAVGDITPQMKKDAADIVNKFGTSTNKNLDSLSILSDPDSMKQLSKLSGVDLATSYSRPGVRNYNAEAINSVIQSPEWTDKMIAAGVKPNHLRKVQVLSEEAAKAQGAQKAVEKTLQNPAFITSVSKKLGGGLPIKLTPAQALKAAKIAEHAAAPTANFLKSAVFENK